MDIDGLGLRCRTAAGLAGAVRNGAVSAHWKPGLLFARSVRTKSTMAPVKPPSFPMDTSQLERLSISGASAGVSDLEKGDGVSGTSVLPELCADSDLSPSLLFALASLLT